MGYPDKATYGSDADKFRPDRWTDKESNIPPPYHFAFGAGARKCTAVNFANRLLYATFVRLILSFHMTESKDMPPNIDPVDYEEDSTASNACASDFKVKFTPRDFELLESCLAASQDGLEDFVTGDHAEPLLR